MQRCAATGDDDVARILSGGRRCDHEALGLRGGQILQRVHEKVALPRQQRFAQGAAFAGGIDQRLVDPDTVRAGGLTGTTGEQAEAASES